MPSNFAFKPIIKSMGIFLSGSIISISFMINSNFTNNVLYFKPGDEEIIDNNIGSGSIYYTFEVEPDFMLKKTGLWDFFKGIDFYIIDQYRDTTLKHYIQYDDNKETFSIEIPEKSKLLVKCRGNNLTGKAKCIVKERKIFPPKNYTNLTSFTDTARVYLISGKENLVYVNHNNTSVLLNIIVSNYFINTEGNDFTSFYDDAVVTFLRSPNEDINAIKPLKNTMFVQPNQEKILTYTIPPEYSLRIMNRGTNIDGYCYYKLVSFAL